MPAATSGKKHHGPPTAPAHPSSRPGGAGSAISGGGAPGSGARQSSARQVKSVGRWIVVCSVPESSGKSTSSSTSRTVLQRKSSGAASARSTGSPACGMTTMSGAPLALVRRCNDTAALTASSRGATPAVRTRSLITSRMTGEKPLGHRPSSAGTIGSQLVSGAR
jgi:hypothetical protein